MSKAHQTPARTQASSSKAQLGAEKGKSQNGPPSISISGPSTVTKPSQQYAKTEDGDESVEQLEGADDIVENDEGDEDGSTAEWQDNDGQEEKLIKALRRMVIKGPKQFDPKRDRNFETWLKRIEFHLKVIKCPEIDRTNALILLLDRDSFEAAQYLGIEEKTKFSLAKQKLKDYFAITEIKEELIDKLDLRRQEHGKSIESFARDIKLIAHRA